MQAQIEQQAAEYEDLEVEFTQYKSEIVIEQRGVVKVLQDQVERLAAELRMKEIEIAQLRVDIQAEYELKLTQYQSQITTW